MTYAVGGTEARESSARVAAPPAADLPEVLRIGETMVMAMATTRPR